jgi:transcriptional regulator with XRE-family HTH domain
MVDIVKLIGEKIKSLRKTKGFTQAELGAKADLLQPFIAAVESGDRNISLETLDKLLLALEVSPGEFLNLDGLDLNTQQEKQALLEIHKSILIKRNIDEIKLIHRITTDILETIDKK